MSMNVSYIIHLEKILTHSGFQKKPWRKGILGTRVYTRGEQAVVVIPSIEIPPPFVTPIPQSIDDYFKRLRDVLIGLAKKHNITDIFFSGGGNIPLPSWFSNWCNQNGIHMHILDAENPETFAFQNQYSK